MSELIMDSNSNDSKDETLTAEKEGGYEEVESEPLLKSNVHPQKVVTEHIPVFHCHTAAENGKQGIPD